MMGWMHLVRDQDELAQSYDVVDRVNAADMPGLAYSTLQLL
jgi:hypothetical protein